MGSSIFIGPKHVVILNNGVSDFYSYETHICSYCSRTGRLTLNNKMWDYSNTTRRYFSKFLEGFTPLKYGSKKKFLEYISNSSNVLVA